MAASDHCWAQEIFQTSTMGALLDGVYEGNVTVRELLRHGDFGLGTFNRLDGEMLVLDGVCYQLRADGSAALADLDELTPFAAVTWFHPDRTIDVSAPHDRGALKARIDEALESTNPWSPFVLPVISARFAPAPSRSSIRRSGPSPRPPRISRR